MGLYVPTLRTITNGSEHTYRKPSEMHIGNIFPISSPLKLMTMIPIAREKMKNVKGFGHLLSPSTINVKQLRHWVFFGAVWLLHLGTQMKLHTKHCLSMQLLFGIPIMKLRQKRWRKCRRQQPSGPAGDGVTGVALTICWTNSSGHP